MIKLFTGLLAYSQLGLAEYMTPTSQVEVQTQAVIDLAALQLVGPTAHGNSRLDIYQDSNHTRWVVRESRPGCINGVINSYSTSKILRLILGDQVVAEERLLPQARGTASKWLTGFIPLNEHFGHRWDEGSVPPAEVNGLPITEREKLVVALDYVGLNDRNGGNLGTITNHGVYVAAQIDYNESLYLFGELLEHTMRAVYNGDLDVQAIYQAADALTTIPSRIIEAIIEDTKTQMLSLIDFAAERARMPYAQGDYWENNDPVASPENFNRYMEKVKAQLVSRKHQLKTIKKHIQLFELMKQGATVETITNFITRELQGELPPGPWGRDYFKALKFSKNLNNPDLVDRVSQVMEGGKQARALLDAVKHKKLSVTQQLLDQGVSPNLLVTIDNVAFSAIHQAIDNFDLDIMRLLLKAGANPNLKATKHERTALHHAALKDIAMIPGHKELPIDQMVDLLLKAGGDPRIVDKWSETLVRDVEKMRDIRMSIRLAIRDWVELSRRDEL